MNAEQIARAFIGRVEAELPGLVSRVHLTGSAGTGDWRAGRSDVDLVVVVAREITAEEAVALRRLHASTRRDCIVDGVYLTAAQLAAGPDLITSAPQSVDGRFATGVRGAQLTWVTWLEVEAGHTLDGQPVGPLFSDTADRAARASRDNLSDYWGRLGRHSRRILLPLPGVVPVPAGAVAWVTLGPPRLVMTIEDGVIASKTDAGLFASAEWPEYSALIDRVLVYRATGTGRFTAADARAALGLLRACIHRGTRYS